MRLYSSVSFIFFGLISFQLLPLSIQQATESCNSTLPLNDLTFDTTLLQCVEAWTPRNYILRYARTAQNTWSFILSAPDASSFIGIGFSTNGQMIGASAVVGWLPTDGSGGQAKQYLLGGKSPGQVTPDRGDLSIVNGSLKVESVSSRIYMSFQLTADVPRPSLLYALGPAGFFPTSPGFGLREHRDMTTTTVDYNTGSQTVVKGSPYSKLRKTHGLLNMFGWGILIIIGALVARHMKQWKPTWFYAHIALQTTGFILGLTGIICGLVLENRTKANNVSKHKGLGITILVMGILQVLALLARPDKDSKYRKYWNWYHHNVGRVMIILAISNIFYGIHLGKAGSSWNVGYGFAVAVLALAAIGLEVKKFMNK
ncbi:Cytochrome b561 and DOMON domain-containing protein [Raphanus sativus]|uniref:Cytochrome b561 and DOMON domain-containing protein At3g07570 n=1 Tax=Raphanus sativus TaxID=3726 RepID=A0A6J0NSC2_RAPSA|nr:cytochrome b561 and DOMON domain-containing protein At3g07570 [Raphanus sativus]KAJ4893113.1 Cytochrome b561 and DOMON domain-containing protein [Raphanus sativus]